jgi:hypothetical protein
MLVVIQLFRALTEGARARSAVARRLCAVAAGWGNSSSDEAPPPGASMPIRRLMPRSSQRPTPLRIPPPPPPATLMPFACSQRCQHHCERIAADLVLGPSLMLDTSAMGRLTR